MNATDVITPLRFEDLNPVGRAIILTVAALTAGVAAVAFLTSYGALYAFVRDTGEYSDRLSRIYPLLLDAAFIVAELAAILFRILRGSKFWPWVTMLLTGFLTVFFNVQHAGYGWDRRLVAALPPIMMMLAFQVDIAVVRSVMLALGRTEQAFGGVAVQQMVPASYQPWWGRSEASAINGQFGQPWAGGGAGTTKRQQIESYLDHLGPDEALRLQARGVTNNLRNYGVDVSERYVKQALDARAGAPSGNGHVPDAG